MKRQQSERTELDRAFLEAVSRTMQTLDEHVNEYVAHRLAQNNIRTNAQLELSVRERDVFALVLEGLSNKEIASHLCISESTAKFHVSAVLRKCGVRSRMELLREHAVAPNLDLVAS